MNNKLILALDTDSLKKAEEIINEVKDLIKFYKIGSQLFTACGPSIVKLVQKNGGKVFLDLKFNDIPNTVASAIKEAAVLGADMLTVHTTGGREMMIRAVEAAKTAGEKSGRAPLIVGVTLLTSLDVNYLREMGINYSSEEFVLRLAGLAKECGLDGVVSSSRECLEIRKKCGPDFKIVTPGIRLAGDSLNDQKRTDTPSKAIKNGASYLVVGRPILEAKDKLAVIRKILNEIEESDV
ncbi:MAG: orotidine-5'-phosphate decarboxylase [bacterium]|nr:orotidine-5'-phosphate decarboxylase [bacterium]